MDTGIGERLRQARSERDLTFEEVHERIKIRVRYLRALEEEGWDVLPGPAYARGFLRTYAEFLDLDADSLVVELKRHQEPEQEPEPVRQLTGEQLKLGIGARVLRRLGLARAALRGLRLPEGAGHGRRLTERIRDVLRRPERLRDRPEEADRSLPEPPPGPPGWPLMVAIAIVGLLVVVGGVGLIVDSGDGNGEPVATEATEEEAGDDADAPEEPSEVVPSRVEVELRATGAVWVCLVNQAGRPLVNSETLAAGAERGPFDARAFEVTFGNGQVELVANGERVRIPPDPNPLGYRVTPERTRQLDDADRPTCT